MKTIWEPTLLFCLSLGSVLIATGVFVYNKYPKKEIVVKQTIDEEYINKYKNEIYRPDTSYLDSDGFPVAPILSPVPQLHRIDQIWERIDCEDKMKPYFLKDKIKYVNRVGDEIIFYKGLWTVKGSRTYKEKVWEWEQQMESLARDPMGGMRPQAQEFDVPEFMKRNNIGAVKKDVVPQKAPWKQ